MTGLKNFFLPLFLCHDISYNLITIKEWQDLNGKENRPYGGMEHDR